jgi:hypothetical protein
LTPHSKPPVPNRTPSFLAALLLAACASDAKLTKGCKTDADCGEPPDRFRCEVESGECRCRTSSACAAGESCNSHGFCQAKVGCTVTAECPSGHFCDPGSSTCLADGRCASDLHCPLGELCDRSQSQCKPGCRSHGDCALRDTCLCKSKREDGSEEEIPCQCNVTTSAERAMCALGRCAPKTCGDNSFCGFGEACRPPPEGGPAQCSSDYDPVYRPYCDRCVYSPGKDTCGKGPNFCITETLTRITYCGADCSQGQSCPNGYRCRDIVVVYSRWECYSNADCGTTERRSKVPCSVDGDCPNSGVCAKEPGQSAGLCAGKCFIREGAERGFCSCVVDDDCFQDECDTVTRTCSVTRRDCTLNGPGCRRIRCVDLGQRGGCQIGQNCTPIEGLTCNDVRK